MKTKNKIFYVMLMFILGIILIPYQSSAHLKKQKEKDVSTAEQSSTANSLQTYIDQRPEKTPKHVPRRLIVHFDKVPANPALNISRLGGKDIRLKRKLLKDNTYLDFGAVQRKFPRRAKRAPKNAVLPNNLNKIFKIFLFEVQEDVSIPELCHKIKKSDTNVVACNPDYIVEAFYLNAEPRKLPPNDPFYHSSGSWGQTYDDLWGLKRVKALQAHDIATGKGVITAVIDSGVDYNHPDIDDNMWTNPGEIPDNGIDDDGNGYIDDVHGYDFAYDDPDPMDGNGHGTHVAGTIAAEKNNGEGIIGVAPDSKIMALKGLGDTGSGSLFDLAEGILYAVMNGADVLNNSWGCSGGCPLEPTTEAVIQAAHGLGAVVVFAAGNDTNNVSVYFPQNMDETICVSSSDENDEMSYFSNYGNLVDFAAPGGGSDGLVPGYMGRNIVSLKANGTSLYNDPEMELGQNNAYIRARGTSMASPHAAGVAAILVEAFPQDSNEEIRARMIATADPFPQAIFYPLGSGILNANRAVNSQPVPLIKFINNTITELNGNNNQIPESDETISLVVDLKNLWVDASFVSASITSNSPDITILNSFSDYGPMVSGETKNNQNNPFVLQIGTIKYDTPVEISLDIDAYDIDGVGYHYTETFNVYLGIRHVVSLASFTNDMDIEGNHFVSGERNGLFHKVFHVSLETGNKTVLASDPDNPLIGGIYPRISGDKIVWKEYSITDPYDYIYYYNAQTGSIQSIYSTTEGLGSPDIEGDLVVWQDMRNGNSDIFIKNIHNPGSGLPLTSDPWDQLTPVISGNYVAYGDTRHSQMTAYECGVKDYYGMNLQTGVEKRLTQYPAHRCRLEIDGDYIVFIEQSRKFGNWNIHMINVVTGDEKIIAQGPAEEVAPDISGERIVWTDNREGTFNIYVHDLTLEETYTLTTDNVNRQVIPVIHGDRVAWIDLRQNMDIYMLELEEEIVPAKLKTPIPNTVLTSTTTTFSWTPGSDGGPSYGLHIGTSPGVYDIYSNANLQDRSMTVTHPVFESGTPIYVDLESTVEGIPQTKHYEFDTGGEFETAIMFDPIPGSRLPITSPPDQQNAYSDVTFQWTPGQGVTEYWLHVSTPYSVRVFKKLTETSQHVPEIELTGDPIYVDLWSYVNGKWELEEYIYETNYAPVLEPTRNLILQAGSYFPIEIFGYDRNGPEFNWSAEVEPDTLDYNFGPFRSMQNLVDFEVLPSNGPGRWKIKITVSDPQGLEATDSFFLQLGDVGRHK
ncbi:S8 family serine peptidase [Thermoproteota archaeon]